MADDMTDKLKSIINNPEMMGMLSSLINSQSEVPQDTDTQSSIAANLKSAMDRINGESDKRINLLNALRPYMRNSRASNIDKAVRMLKLTQLTSILKDL